MNERSDRAAATKQEELRVAKRLGGTRVPRSGGISTSRWHPATMGGDFETPLLLGEHKRTEAASMSVKREWLEKVSEGALLKGKVPALVFTFMTESGGRVDWLAVPVSDAARLLGLDVDDLEGAQR